MKNLIPFLLLLIVGVVQTYYSFTKFDSTVAAIISVCCWGFLLFMLVIIRLQKRKLKAGGK